MHSVQVDLSVQLGKIRLQNPVMPASGTFGYGREFSDFVDLNELGATHDQRVDIRAQTVSQQFSVCLLVQFPAGLVLPDHADGRKDALDSQSRCHVHFLP